MDDQQRDPAPTTDPDGGMEPTDPTATDPTAPESGPAAGMTGTGPAPTGPEDATTGEGEPASSARSTGATGRVDVQQMLGQLQGMIDQVAVQASPALREVAAKAAELAAKAGERAGPLAQRAAEATAVVGQRVAERSSQLATDLRTAQGTAGSQPADPDPGSGTSATASEPPGSEETPPPGA